MLCQRSIAHMRCVKHYMYELYATSAALPPKTLGCRKRQVLEVGAIGFVWVNHRLETHTSARESRLVAKLINQEGGNAQVLKLGEDAGLKGSTHIPFAVLDNTEVAGILDDLLEENGLDEYKDGDD